MRDSKEYKEFEVSALKNCGDREITQEDRDAIFELFRLLKDPVFQKTPSKDV